MGPNYRSHSVILYIRIVATSGSARHSCTPCVRLAVKTDLMFVALVLLRQ